MEFFASVVSAAIDNNLVLTQIIGMLTVFLIAVRPKDAVRYAAWLWAVVSISAALGWWTYTGLLAPWGVAYLAPIVYVLLSSVVVFVGGAFWGRGKDLEARRGAVHICGLIAVNACVLGAPLSMAATVAADASVLEVLGTAVGDGLGVFLAIAIFCGLRERVNDQMIPACLRGLPVALITASLVALAFSCVTGMAGIFGV